MPGYDTLGTLRLLRTTPDLAEHDHSWSVLTKRILEKEFALSGLEQNPDLTGHDLRHRRPLALGVSSFRTAVGRPER